MSRVAGPGYRTLLRSTVRALVVAFAVSAGASGCSVETGPTASDRTAEEEIALWVEIAAEVGVSDAQMEILKRAQDRGGLVTAGDVDEAYQETLRCYESAGLNYRKDRFEATTGSNIWVPSAVIIEPPGATEEEAMRIADVAEECENRHHIWVSSAYMNQPSSRQAQDAVWVSESVIACLEERGYRFPEEISADEVRQAEGDDLAKNQNNPNYAGRCVPNQS